VRPNFLSVAKKPDTELILIEIASYTI
jgi:hypothetical protein